MVLVVLPFIKNFINGSTVTVLVAVAVVMIMHINI